MGIKVLIDLNDNELEQLQVVANHVNARNRTQAIRNAIYIAFNEVTPPAYARLRAPIDPKDRAKRKIEYKKETETLEKDECIALCNQLEGVYDEKTNTCAYKTYRYVNENIPPIEGERVIPITDITPDLVDAQYGSLEDKDKIKQWKNKQQQQ